MRGLNAARVMRITGHQTDTGTSFGGLMDPKMAIARNRLAIPLAVATAIVGLVACSSGSVATKIVEFHESIDVWSLAFSPDGQHLAVSSPTYTEVHVWKWPGKTPELVQKLQQQGGGQLNGLRFTRDGKFLASAHGPGKENQLVRIWSGLTWSLVGDIAEVKAVGGVLENANLEFTPDAKFLVRVAGGGWYMDGLTKVILVDGLVVYDGDTRQRLWGLPLPVNGEEFALSPDARSAVVVGMERRERNGDPFLQAKLCLVDLDGKQVASCDDILPGASYLGFAAWSPDGHYIAVSGDPGESSDPGKRGKPLPGPGLALFDVKNRRTVSTFPVHDHLAQLEYSPDGRYLVVGSWFRGVEIWNSEHTKLLQHISGRITAAKLSVDGRHLAVANGEDVTIWDIR